MSFCPTHALKIVKNDCTFRENANWQADTIREIYKPGSQRRRAAVVHGDAEGAAGVLGPDIDQRLAGDDPPIDPLREPMETRVFLGKKPAADCAR